jgi:hypothetical protein
VDATQRATFISDYAKVVVSLWHNPQFSTQLNSDPAAALASCGLATKAGAKFNIVRRVSGSGDIDQQVNAWERGETTGEYTLYLPPSQESVQSVQLDTQDLEELHGHKGGVAQAASDVDVCCCCTPCCTCS